MKTDTKCSIALHTLLLIAATGGKAKMTSEAIAQSVGVNPVIIRNILGALKRAGLVQVYRGTGGATLALPPQEITVWQVYCAVRPQPETGLMGMHKNPSPLCPVGSRVHGLLHEAYAEIDQAVQKAMQGYTLAQLLANLQEDMGGAAPVPFGGETC